MATLATTGRESDHENRHPMSMVAYSLVVLIIPALGWMMLSLAQHQTGAAIASAIALVVTVVGSATIYTAMARRLQHSPLLPEDSAAEKDRYLAKYRRG